MQWNKCLICSVAWFLLFCFAPVCTSSQKHRKSGCDKHTRSNQAAQSRKKFCDPSFSNQTPGAITQKCSSGFYREWSGPHRGQCVPCSCNGLSTECEEQTGNCVNCQFNTTGDRCERCKEGYYGNPANRTCRACPCPFTWNNFALACLDIGSGEVECLCKRGYHGATCERCSSGYYGNPLIPRGTCRPCNCKDGTFNICDSLTGACATSGNNSWDDKCHECDTCPKALLGDLEQMDDSLVWLKRQLQNISTSPGSLRRLKNLEAHISETKIQVGGFGTAVRHLDPKVEQLEADVDVAKDDLSQMIDETLETSLDQEVVLSNVNRTKLKAEDLLDKAKSLPTAIQDLMKQLTEVKPAESMTLSENNKTRMFEKAQLIVREMRERSCTARRDTAGSEQQKAQKLFDLIGNNMTAPLETNPAVLTQTADSLMASLREMAELQSVTEDTVSRIQGLNLKSRTILQHLQHLQTQLENGQSVLLPLTEMTKDLLKNITGMFSALEEIKKDYEHYGAQLDGTKSEVFNKLNNIAQIREKVDIVTKAEEHVEQLKQLVEEFKRGLHNATSTTDQFRFLHVGAYNGIKYVIERAEMAANQSRVAADGALKDVKEEGLVKKVKRLKDNSTHLWKEANETHSELEILSHTANSHKSRSNEQKEKGESLTMDIKALGDNLKKIKRDDTDALIASAKTAASDSNSTVSNIAERLRNISQEVDQKTLTNVSRSVDGILNEAEQALKILNVTLPLLKDNVTHVEALSRKAHPPGNMTDSIKRIKDVIEETRNFVNRLSIATTFNGKGHIELRPPRNLADIKAFTAVDLLLNLHRSSPSKAERRRKRRQDRHKDASHFVFYLGDKNAYGDYIGMSVRRNVLMCVYKLGGIVHQVANGEITTTTNVNSSDLDRVVFHRVYQDAEVNVTQNFTSQRPVRLSLNRNLPNTLSGLLHVDPESVVFYVGGYPEDFTPPEELRYPKYRGAMKLSYINDNPVCLFNYKRAVNINAKKSHVWIPHSDVSDYFEGTGYRMAFMKDKKRTRLFKFHTNSRETNALLFYIGNEESFFCLYVERGFLVIRGQQSSREFRAQSAEKVSLFDKKIAIIIGDEFKVQYGSELISTDHIQTKYTYYYIGGLSAELRQRYNITAPPLRGCVDHVTANTEIVQYDRTIGVGKGCPVSLLGVRTATLDSALPVESLFVGDKPGEVRVSLGFRSKDRHSVLLRSSSQGSTSDPYFQLALADGYVVFNSDNYTLKSEKRYSDGSWHYLSAVGSPTWLELSIDNVNVIQGQSPENRQRVRKTQGEKHKACVTNLYARRFEQSFIPADLSSFPQTEDAILGLCSLDSPPQTGPPLTPVVTKPKKHKKPVLPSTADSQCRQWTAPRGEYQLYDTDSWMIFTFPQEDLNHRPHFSLDVKTTSSKGLILHVAGSGVVPLLALYVANGKIKMSLGQNRIIEHKRRSNDGNWHRVEFSVEKSTFHLLVDGLRVTDGDLPNNEGSSLNLRNPVYLGADTKSKATKGHDIPMTSFVGCVRVFKMNDVPVEKPQGRYRTLPCFDEHTVKGMYFGADGGHIILDNYFKVGSQFELTFELRPEQLTGLLFHVHGHKRSLNVFLVENKVGVEVNDGSGALSVTVSPPQSLCDGTFHVISVSKRREVIKLVVDSVSEEKAGPSTSTLYSTTLDSLYIGGTTNPNRAPVSSPFVGCLRNVKVNGQPVAFEKASRVVGNVSIQKCPAE